MGKARSKAGLTLAAVLFLAACEAAGSLAGGGSQSDYLVARQALETGNYDLAVRRYGRLMQSVDATRASRLQLEYAHALLRGDRYEDAIAAADTLIAAREGTIRASALAVRGTARHEAARLRLAEGQGDAVTRTLLEGARDDIASFLADHGSLDAAGSMRARAALIGADLAGIG
jgi:tetratricopeptide (TPR) repeat protein